MNSRSLWIAVAVLFVVFTTGGILMLKRFDPATDSELIDDGARTTNTPSASTTNARPAPQETAPAAPPVAASTETIPAPDASDLEQKRLTLDQLRDLLVRPGAWENEALLTFRNAQALADFLALARAAGIEIEGPFGDALTLRARFDALEDFSRLLESLEGPPPFVGPNYFVSVPRVAPPSPEAAGGTGTAPFDDFLFKSLGIPDSANRGTWGDGVMVAVIDSGISDHPTFRDGQVRTIDLVGENVPLHGHGTAMASLIAGNQDGAFGISPAANLLDIRIAGSDGLSDSYLLAQGIQVAIDNNADIMNISLGTYGDSPVVAGLVAEAVKKGILIVAPTGNEQVDQKAWPAAYPGVISVSGVDAKDQLAFFSNTGSPTLAAPAVGIPSAYFAENRVLIGTGNGTSQAAALVSGTLAHLKARGLNPSRALTTNARPIQGGRSNFGAGVLFLPSTMTR